MPNNAGFEFEFGIIIISLPLGKVEVELFVTAAFDDIKAVACCVSKLLAKFELISCDAFELARLVVEPMRFPINIVIMISW